MYWSSYGAGNAPSRGGDSSAETPSSAPITPTPASDVADAGTSGTSGAAPVTEAAKDDDVETPIDHESGCSVSAPGSDAAPGHAWSGIMLGLTVTWLARRRRN